MVVSTAWRATACLTATLPVLVVLPSPLAADLWQPVGNGFDFVPDAESQAVFLRFHVEGARCIRMSHTGNLSTPLPLPFVASMMFGGQLATHAGSFVNQTPPNDAPEKDIWLAGQAVLLSSRRSDHVSVNVSVDGWTVHSHHEKEGYDETREDFPWLRGWSAACYSPGRMQDGDYWLAATYTGPVQNLKLRVDALEDIDVHAHTFDPGNGSVELLAESESAFTFVHELVDFNGTVSYSGDPLGFTQVPNTLGLNLALSQHVPNGMEGSMLGVELSPHSATMSYAGPAGEFGTGSNTLENVGLALDQVMLIHFSGAPGEWRFNVHSDAEVGSRSSLMVWGAGIERPPWPPQ